MESFFVKKKQGMTNHLACKGFLQTVLNYKIANISSSDKNKYSSPPLFHSSPAYLPNKILSPFFTDIAILLPLLLTFPVPTAMTSPFCGFSFATSGIMMLLAVFSSASNLLIKNAVS